MKAVLSSRLRAWKSLFAYCSATCFVNVPPRPRSAKAVRLMKVKKTAQVPYPLVPTLSSVKGISRKGTGQRSAVRSPENSPFLPSFARTAFSSGATSLPSTANCKSSLNVQSNLRFRLSAASIVLEQAFPKVLNGAAQTLLQLNLGSPAQQTLRPVNSRPAHLRIVDR